MDRAPSGDLKISPVCHLLLQDLMGRKAALDPVNEECLPCRSADVTGFHYSTFDFHAIAIPEEADQLHALSLQQGLELIRADLAHEE